ncbi:MAG: hypothetical protein MJ211_12005 [Bacteroidales bacterium]|nr:hypothetical protein [Bacteroidales bacterium]
MKRFIIYLFLFCFIISCNSQTNIPENIKFTKINEDSIPCKILDVEKINLPEEFVASRYYVVKDTILLVLHDQYPDPYYLSVVNLNNFEIINQLFQRGNGPNDLLGVLSYINDDYLCLNDYVKRTVARIHVDSLLVKDFTYPSFIKIDAFYEGFGWINDSLIVASNCLHFDGFGNEKYPELLYVDTTGAFIEDYPKDGFDIFTANFSGGYIAMNSLQNKFYHAKKFKPEICFYVDNKLEKVIIGPEEYNSEFIVDKNNQLHFKDNFHYYYFNYCSSKNNVFFKNERFHGKVGTHFSDDEGKGTEIFRLDWNGNLLARYKIPTDKAVIGLSYNENTNSLYLTSFDENGERILYKAILND